jgi:hypothetical protein
MLTYKQAAAIMTLDVADLEFSIAEHGRCDTEFWICIPFEPPEKETWNLQLKLQSRKLATVSAASFLIRASTAEE